MRYAEIALNQGGARQTYHYHIPEALEPIQIGHLVEVSFGTGLTSGMVVNLTPDSPIPQTKPILEVLDAEPVVTPAQIEIARLMAGQTLSSLGACLWLTLPPGLARSGDRLYTLIDSTLAPAPGTLSDQVVTLLHERGALRGTQIDHAIESDGWKRAIKPLLDAGQITSEAILNAPAVHTKTSRTVMLSAPSGVIEAALSTLKPDSKRLKVLTYLRDTPGVHDAKTLIDLTESDSGTLKRLADKGWIVFGESEAWRDPLAGREFVAVDAPPLTPDQAACWDVLKANISARREGVYLLHGVTGSGKTELYLRAIELAREQGRAAIVLVPEIALVPQTVRRFMARFSDRVALVHSGLSAGQQYDTWRRARAGLIDIVIGARSALFAPFSDIGVIVLDEEHDASYKQSPPIPPPYYHAREVAIDMARVYQATVILGSATPDLVTAWRAERGTIHYLQLPDRVMVHKTRLEEQSAALHVPLAQFQERYTPVAPAAPDALSAPLPPVQIVDMRDELKAGNRTIFSAPLRTELQATLDDGHQAILFLNRRGSASFVLCRDCGYIAKCPRCDAPLTYHEHAAHLTCHTCGFHAPPPTVCPSCGSQRIRYFGAGTELLEKIIADEFPQARAIRWDRDTTKERGAHEAILNDFAHGDANILIGTQMIAKGLDIPRVTLVGVISADTALGLPDYRAGERAFQLLTQVAGRAGRSWLGGRVIIQTYQPEHYAVVSAALHDTAGFYQKEMAYRETLQYPPFMRLARVLFRYPSAAKAEREANRIAGLIQATIQREGLSATRIIGPAPAFFQKVNDVYRWQLVVKSTNPAAALTRLTVIPGMYIDIDPLDML